MGRAGIDRISDAHLATGAAAAGSEIVEPVLSRSTRSSRPSSFGPLTKQLPSIRPFRCSTLGASRRCFSRA